MGGGVAIRRCALVSFETRAASLRHYAERPKPFSFLVIALKPYPKLQILIILDKAGGGWL